MSGTDSFDLEAYRAAHAEATGASFPIKLGIVKDDDGTEHDETIYIPPLRQWALTAQERLANGDVVGCIEEVSGPEAADLFRTYQWTLGEFEALFEALSHWAGFQVGRPSSSRPPRPVSIRR